MSSRPPLILSIALVVVVFALFLFAFAYGFAVNKYRLFPYDLAIEFETALKWTASQAPGNSAWYYQETSRTQMITAGAEQTPADNLNLITSVIENNTLSQRIIDMSGQLVHEWRIDWFELWPDAQHLPKSDIPKTRPGTHIHGTALFPDGDIVFNFEQLGTVRMNACGEVLWKLPYRTHHSIFTDDDGNLWLSAQRTSTEVLPLYPKHLPPVREPVVLQISPDGDVLQEISVMELLDKNGLRALLQMRADSITNIVRGDTLHLNDVEIFSADMQEGFFAHGDILISLRNINTVLVFDPDSLEIKFIKTGGFVRQHDPDFIDGNTVSLFDNNNIGPPGFGQQSRILLLNANSGELVTYFSGNESIPFYTDIMGKHQWLANGELLITDSKNGRAFQLDKNRKLVWEFINLLDDGRVGIVEEVQRLPAEAADWVSRAACHRDLQ